MAKTLLPTLFIGSSVESLEIAYAIQENLEYDAECTVWSQGIFELSETTLDSLINSLEKFDFAILVFTPDDILKLRNKTFTSTRDNVIFELGLFIAKLGKLKTFVLMPRGEENFRLPTDLVGITPATYEPNRRDRNINAAIGPACSKIRKAIQSAGPIRRKIVREATKTVTGGFYEELKEEISRSLGDQEKRIEQIVERFEKGLERFLEYKHELNVVNESENDLEFVITKKLSPLAQALLQALAKVHLTFDEYQKLSISSLNSALIELRNNNILFPLTGYDRKGKTVPVYWFSSADSELILQIIKRLKTPPANLRKIVKNELLAADYDHYSGD